MLVGIPLGTTVDIHYTGHAAPYTVIVLLAALAVWLSNGRALRLHLHSLLDAAWPLEGMLYFLGLAHAVGSHAIIFVDGFELVG